MAQLVTDHQIRNVQAHLSATKEARSDALADLADDNAMYLREDIREAVHELTSYQELSDTYRPIFMSSYIDAYLEVVEK